MGSCVWQALKTFKDDRHKAWQEANPSTTGQMWKDLEQMGVVFVDGILPPYNAKKNSAEKQNGRR